MEINVCWLARSENLRDGIRDHFWRGGVAPFALGELRRRHEPDLLSIWRVGGVNSGVLTSGNDDSRGAKGASDVGRRGVHREDEAGFSGRLQEI